jgi:hypothetical protein
MYLKEHWLPLLEDAIGRYCKDKYVLDFGCAFASAIQERKRG